jgi:probable rRNA maturation factor
VAPAKRTIPSRVLLRSDHPSGGRQLKALGALGNRFLSALKLEGAELSVALVTDEAIAALNKTWRKKNKPTDVLSFPAGEPPPGSPGPRLLGDVVISLDTARRVAAEESRRIDRELARYLAHGVLHLLGYDHERGPKEAKRMAQWEERLLGEAGMLGGGPRLAKPRKRSLRPR